MGKTSKIVSYRKRRPKEEILARSLRVRKGAKRYCIYGTCKSDSRNADEPEMTGVTWIPFPKPHLQHRTSSFLLPSARVGSGKVRQGRSGRMGYVRIPHPTHPYRTWPYPIQTYPNSTLPHHTSPDPTLPGLWPDPILPDLNWSDPTRLYPTLPFPTLPDHT